MGSLVGSVKGAEAASDQLDAANSARDQALRLFAGINLPSITEQELDLQQYQNAGDFTPQMLQALQAGSSAMEGIQTDPRLLEAQMSALNHLSQVGQMGMTPAEAAALSQSNREAQSMAQAKSSQILDNMARRGMGGSGAELSSQLQNAQSAADRLSQQNNQIAQSAQQNALQAVSQAGALGGQIGQQQFGQQSDVAKAKDYINQFNLQNSQNVQGRNVDSSNQAALRNLMNQQNVMQQNTGLANQQQQHNKGLLQQQFNNEMARAGGMSGQYQGIAQANERQAGRTADMWAGIGQGIDTGAGAAYNAYNKSGGGSDVDEFTDF